MLTVAVVLAAAVLSLGVGFELGRHNREYTLKTWVPTKIWVEDRKIDAVPTRLLWTNSGDGNLELNVTFKEGKRATAKNDA